MASLWLGPTHRRPAVELLTDSGERLPLPLPTGAGAADSMLDRSGWVVLQIGYEVMGLRDGHLLRPSRLPDAWSIAPAADPSLVLLRRYFGRSREDDEPEVIELVDAHGRVLKSVAANVWGAVGELSSGWIATYDSLLSWEGEQRPLPVSGQAVAVLSGRHLVVADRDTASVRIVDAWAQRTTSRSVAPDSYWLGPAYNPDASRVAFATGVPIVVTEDDACPLDATVDFGGLAWVDREHVLVSHQGARRSFDVVTSESVAVGDLPARSSPRIEVSGRFDLGQLRSALRPKWASPIPPDAAAGIRLANRTAIETGGRAAGLPVDELLRSCVDAVRLRSCFATGRVPVGASHFGGRPDLPASEKWPTYEGQPMMFLGQFRSDDVNAALPGSFPSDDVLVSVFVAIEPDGGYPVADDAVTVRVVALEGLRRVPWPARVPAELRLDMSIAVGEPMMTLATDAGVADRDTLYDLAESLAPSGPKHQMFGVPLTIQDRESAPGRRLLLQFDGDPLLGGPELGDGGRLLIWTAAAPGNLADLATCTVQLDSH